MAEQMVERPLRSVFVGNIPYEVTEEKLKEIFSEVGPVISLKLVYDRETGKPKGYGFCEYKDVETATSAMRNLNGYEINNRVLRVDNAGAERIRMGEINSNQNSMGHNGPRHESENPFQMMANVRDDGPPPPEKAPEVIHKAVASLPPEQMFELMKQMKLCIQNNPNEARTMLLQNPQLAYALLQAQVVMKIIDPPTALSMLHKDNQLPVGSMGTLLPEGQMNMMSSGFGPSHNQPPPTENPWITAAAGAGVPLMPPNPPGPFGPGPGPVPPVTAPIPGPGGDMDLRQLDPRLRNQTGGPPQDFDLRDPRGQSQQERFSMDPRRDRDLRDRDMRDRDMRSDRDLRDRDMRERDRDMRDPRMEARDRDMRDRDLRDPRAFSGNNIVPNNSAPSDPRARRNAPTAGSTEAPALSSSAGSVAAAAKANPFPMAGLGPGASDTEKAALIMQVLQLSEEQISMLPPEQRQSILVLKEQIAKSTSQPR